ncbi:helix-turn-helix domain-containing protein [Chitinophaga flava]|uniref:AraC family transcriptional regulator n=1 Tax=Chitinophaga flava TaxID=2259036 RepID=A0A365Y355_9BACT|nr:helix-turn-helix domain-containing protein [Chitinophaga flava]RBL92384.1 AraC family transcriptional regulator [Chitinophaga flava]
MKHNGTKPCQELAPYIHSFWELKGDDSDGQWERIFPDGCPGIVINLGEPCKTDNGLATMDYGKTYIVGAMTTFKDSFIDRNTHLLGVCLKPAVFSSFYNYAPQNELTNHTVEFDLPHSFDIGKINKDSYAYLNKYFLDRKGSINQPLQAVLNDIHISKGNVSIREISKRNFTTVRQLERIFKTHVGLTPKEYVKIIRFQSVLSMMNNIRKKSLSDIAFECGFYDQAHLTNEVKRHTGLTPAQF